MAKDAITGGDLNVASSLGEALKHGKVNFKKSKYDMPDIDPRAQKQVRRGNQNGRGVFNNPPKHEPKMDYSGGRPSANPNSFLPAIQQLMQQEQIKKSQEPARSKSDAPKTKGDEVGSMIDDLLKSVKS